MAQFADDDFQVCGTHPAHAPKRYQMNDQLDKLESSIARLVQAYNALKAENAALKAQLADKSASVELLEEEAAAVRSRIDALIASLTTDQPAQQPSA